MSTLREVDEELYRAIEEELTRQRQTIELIASENLVARPILEAVGSVLTNKYAEGYPGARYYGGCQAVDVVESLAIERAKALFECDYANVQPHSGSQANMAVFFTVLNPGDTVLGMDLSHGGHLTHGAAANFSGRLYNSESYGVSRETECIDYDEVLKIAKKTRPKLIVAGVSAYSRILDFEKFRAIADEVGAYLMVDMAHVAGLIAAKLYPSPLIDADFTTTTTHKTLRGARGGMILIGKDRENDMGIKAPKSGRVKRFSELVNLALFPGTQGGPLLHVIAGKAAAFKAAATPEFKEYQKQILANARKLAEVLTAGGARVISGGTETHLFSVDVTPFGITGKKAEALLDEADITLNKNTIPFDPHSPFVTSGVRIGTPAITSRGTKESEMERIGNFILEILRSKGDPEVTKRVKKGVKELLEGFPLYPHLS